jgi:hypothetical protein
MERGRNCVERNGSERAKVASVADEEASREESAVANAKDTAKGG